MIFNFQNKSTGSFGCNSRLNKLVNEHLKYISFSCCQKMCIGLIDKEEKLSDLYAY